MNRHFCFAVCLFLLVPACWGDDKGTPDAAMNAPDTTPAPPDSSVQLPDGPWPVFDAAPPVFDAAPPVFDAAPPLRPALGTQVDRAGRPGINAWLDKSFSDPSQRDPARDAYNQASDPQSWGTSFASAFVVALGILDGIDTSCGNQFLAAPLAGAGRYDALAGLLADDRLYINTAGATCSVFLAVEANATGVLANNDCGGYLPSYDVVDELYSLFIAGTVTGVADGVTAATPTSDTTFPFLAAPNWSPDARRASRCCQLAGQGAPPPKWLRQ